MLQTYQHIWLCGLAASGKTTLLQWLHKKYPSVNFLNDSQETVEFIRNDTECKHHTKPSLDTFLLIDSVVAHYSVKSLIGKVASSNQINIIELSRGCDQKKVVDFSYSYLFSQLPEEIMRNSLFVYVYSPYASRLKRNSNRSLLPKKKFNVFSSFYCPEEAMERFFQSDDFFEAIKDHPVDSLVLSNIYSLDDYYSKIGQLFRS
ncbi:MAG: hypothetical protein ABIJ03_03065 [Patescibacteria group bacterium]|nr:hypothetical protein [Patescibacteria group bacterium]